MNLKSLYKNLINSGIKLAEPDFLRKVRVLNGFQLIFILLVPLLGLYYFHIKAGFLFLIVIFSSLLMIPGIVILRKSRNLPLAGNYTVFILWVVILLISWNTGAINYQGIIRPTFILNAGLILWAVFLNGYLSGTIWTIIVLLETGLMVYLYRSGYEFPNLIPLEIEAAYSMGSFLICLMAMLLIAFLFRKEKDEATIREKENYQALRESKRYVENILQQSPLPTFIIDRSHRVVQWNKACERLTGVRSDEIIGQEIRDGLRVDDRGSVADLLLEHPDIIKEKFGAAIISKINNTWFEIETPLENIKNGIRAIITAAPILDNQGTVRGAIQTIQELGPIHPGETGLGSCSFASCHDPVFRINREGKISFWNKACEAYLGYAASEMIDRNPLTIVSKPYHQLFKKTVEQSLRGISGTRQEWSYQHKQGMPVYVYAKVCPVFNTTHTGKECVVINTDITGLNRKFKKLEFYATDRNEKFKALSEEYDLLRKNLATYLRKKGGPTSTV